MGVGLVSVQDVTGLRVFRPSLGALDRGGGSAPGLGGQHAAARSTPRCHRSGDRAVRVGRIRMQTNATR
jgi:hypothetical protein